MRTTLLVTAGVLLLIELGGSRTPVRILAISPIVTTSAAPTERVDFDTQIKPILQSKCMPCHFSGGKVYERLPFDRAETIRKLGTRLFTRIKEESDRKLFEQFLAQTP